MVVHRDISWADLWQITVNATFLIAQILIIVTAAGIYSWLLTTSGIPQQVVAFFHTAHMPPWEVMLLINLGLLMIGSFLEPPAAITILTPLLLPLVPKLKLQGMGEEDRFFLYFALQAMRHGNLLMYAPTIPVEIRDRLPFVTFVDGIEDAVTQARAKLPRQAEVLIVPHGGSTYPILPN